MENNFLAHLDSKSPSLKQQLYLQSDISRQQKVSWQEFFDAVNDTAAFLLDSGIEENTPVILAVEDPLYWLKAFFAAIQLGAMPILVNFRDAFFFREVLAMHPEYAICTDSSELPATAKAILLAEIGKTEQKIPIAAKTAEDLFFALYTSGSLGKPKYVEKTYRNITVELDFLRDLVGLKESDTVLALVPYVHIYGLLFGVLLPFVVGANIVHSTKLLPAQAIRDVNECQADFLVAAPIHYQAFVKAAMEDVHQPDLRLAISSGAPLTPHTARSFFTAVDVPILELYGSTETGGIGHRTWRDNATGYFQLFPYVEVSSEREPPCELKLRSPAISQNTVERAWYSTGDYAEFASENCREFTLVGRQQGIIKFAGRRISATQLEQELKSIDSIKDAAVIRISDASLRGERAVAYVELYEGVNLTATALKKQLAKISRNTGVFAKFQICAQIPRNHNGKVAYSLLNTMWETSKKAQKLRVGVIVPTYNHGATIREVVNSCLLYIPQIIVVIDGATDDTVEKLKDLPITTLHFAKNRGKGAALKSAFGEAKTLGWDYALTLDSDGQHKAECIPQFLRAIEDHNGAIIVGDRDMSAVTVPSSSKFGKWFTNFWLKVETGVDVADGQSGFRVYPIESICQLKTLFNRYEFEVEILARAIWSGIKVVSIPITVEYPPAEERISHFRPFMDNVRTSILNTILVTLMVCRNIGKVLQLGRKR